MTKEIPPRPKAGDDLRFMRRGFYWLHLETDSVVVRAEKEELFPMLSHGLSAMSRPSRCSVSTTDAGITAHATGRVETPVLFLQSCATPARRSTCTLANEHGPDDCDRVSLAAGAYGNPMFGGICNLLQLGPRPLFTATGWLGCATQRLGSAWTTGEGCSRLSRSFDSVWAQWARAGGTVRVYSL